MTDIPRRIQLVKLYRTLHTGASLKAAVDAVDDGWTPEMEPKAPDYTQREMEERIEQSKRIHWWWMTAKKHPEAPREIWGNAAPHHLNRPIAGYYGLEFRGRFIGLVVFDKP